MSNEMATAVQKAILPSLSQYIMCELVPSITRPGKTDKFPCNAGGVKTSIHDKSIYFGYEQAKLQAEMLSQSGRDFRVGFVFTSDDQFVFIDLDSCLLPDGKWSPVAIEIVNMFPGAYVEVSQSGSGLHIVAQYTGAEPIHASKNQSLNIELYTSSRFMALGNITTARGDAHTDHTTALYQLISKYFNTDDAPTKGNKLDAEWTTTHHQNSNPIKDDDELIKKACSRKSAESVFGNKASFDDLWTGNEKKLSEEYPDDTGNQDRLYDASSADMALALMLMWWTGGNCERVERLMRKSALMRPKWDKNKTYLNHFTICKAHALVTEYYGQHQLPVSLTPAEGATNTIHDFYFIRPANKFYNYYTGVSMTPKAFNQSESADVGTASSGFKTQVGKNVDGLFWFPCAHNETPNETGIIDGQTMVNTYRKPAEYIPDADYNKVRPYINHMNYLIADQDILNVLLDHMAFTMQYPNKKINWQILWSGATRIGKDLSLKPIAGYYGNMYNDIHPDDDEANKWGDIKAKRKVLAYQEVHRPKDRKFANGLKTYAADTGSGVMTLNMKGGGQIKQYNLFSMYCMSNYTDAIHLTDDDERWFVINSMKVVKKEREYYEQLVDWLDTGGIEAVIRWLLARDLSHFSVSTPPFHTQAKLDLVEESLSDNYRAIETMMHSGAGVFRSDVTVFSRSMLKEFMEKNGSRRVNESILSEELKELLGVDGSSVAKQKNNFARVFINPKSSLHNDAADLLTPSVLYDEYIKSLKIMSIMRYS